MKRPSSPGAEGNGGDSRLTTRWSIVLPLTFCAFVGGLVIWVVHLIRLSLRMHDVPNASVGISLVAIPVFLLLLGVFNYLYWGLLRNRE